LKIKLRDRHFDTIEEMETESQAVLNTLTEHDFKDALKNGRSIRNGSYSTSAHFKCILEAVFCECVQHHVQFFLNHPSCVKMAALQF
jgi:hypothetical protein